MQVVVTSHYFGKFSKQKPPQICSISKSLFLFLHHVSMQIDYDQKQKKHVISESFYLSIFTCALKCMFVDEEVELNNIS